METHIVLKKILVDNLGVDENEITPEARLVEDLGADDFDLATLFTECEKLFNVKISDELCDNITTVYTLQYVIANLILGKEVSVDSLPEKMSWVCEPPKQIQQIPEPPKQCYLISSKIYNSDQRPVLENKVKFLTEKDLSQIGTIEQLEHFILRSSVEKFCNERCNGKKKNDRWVLEDYKITKL